MKDFGEILIGLLFVIGICLIIIGGVMNKIQDKQQRHIDAVKQAIIEICQERGDICKDKTIHLIP
jgi:Ca2+/H+ antiporter